MKKLLVRLLNQWDYFYNICIRLKILQYFVRPGKALPVTGKRPEKKNTRKKIFKKRIQRD